MYGDPAAFVQKDQEKQVGCKRQNITLIEIPYWWNGSKEDVLATIHKHRPDVVSDPGSGRCIPKQSPPSVQDIKHLKF
jgi:hypothetical protein